MTVLRSWKVDNPAPSPRAGKMSVQLQSDHWDHIVKDHIEGCPSEPWQELSTRADRQAIVRACISGTTTSPVADQWIGRLASLTQECAAHPLCLSFFSRFKNDSPGRNGRPVESMLFLLRVGLLVVTNFMDRRGSAADRPNCYVVTAYFPKRAVRETRHDARQLEVIESFVERYNRHRSPKDQRRHPDPADQFEIADAGRADRAPCVRVHRQVRFHSPSNWGFDADGLFDPHNAAPIRLRLNRSKTLETPPASHTMRGDSP